MKKQIIFSFIVLVIVFSVDAKKIKGQILYSNDTVNVTFNISVKFFTQEPNYERLQQKVYFLNSDGVKKTLRPQDAKEIRFEFNGENIRMLSRENSLGLGNIFSTNSHIFLRIEIDGNLKLFNYYYTQHSPGMYNAGTGMITGGYSYTVERFVLQKGDAMLKRPAGLTFRKDMLEFFADCPDLSKKIENREFGKNDLSAIVNFYNEGCK